MNEKEYENFVKWEIEQESIREYAELHELISEKNIFLVTCNIALEHKNFYTNMLVYIGSKCIISKVVDFTHFIAELETFYVDETAKFVELKSKKTENGIIKSLKIKETEIYLSQAETKAIIKVANRIERASRYASSDDIKKCEKYDYWHNLLIKSQIIED